MFVDKDKMMISSVQLGAHMYHRSLATFNHNRVEKKKQKNNFTAAMLLLLFIMIDP